MIVVHCNRLLKDRSLDRASGPGPTPSTAWAIRRLAERAALGLRIHWGPGPRPDSEPGRAAGRAGDQGARDDMMYRTMSITSPRMSREAFDCRSTPQPADVDSQGGKRQGGGVDATRRTGCRAPGPSTVRTALRRPARVRRGVSGLHEGCRSFRACSRPGGAVRRCPGHDAGARCPVVSRAVPA